MKTEKTKGDRAGSEMQLELKYCERCGGLWLRPGGGGQIYCAGCARAIAELPAASGKARMPQGPRWGVNQGVYEGGEEDESMDMDAAGGVA
jgi:hypothetical protein